MDQHHVGRAAVRDQLHDALGVGVSAERHVLEEEKENVLTQHCKTTLWVFYIAGTYEARCCNCGPEVLTRGQQAIFSLKNEQELKTSKVGRI